MSVTVTTASAGTQELAEGADWDIMELGILLVVDGNGDSVAAFAPGVWQSAVVSP